jgi:hypothetical protein
MIDGAVERIRDIIHALRPLTLDELGLPETLSGKLRTAGIGGYRHQRKGNAYRFSFIPTTKVQTPTQVSSLARSLVTVFVPKFAVQMVDAVEGQADRIQPDGQADSRRRTAAVRSAADKNRERPSTK